MAPKKPIPTTEWPEFPSESTRDNLTLNQATVDEQLDADWGTLQGTPPKEDVPKLSQGDLKKFVQDYLAGSVFISAQVREQNLLPTIFMPIALGALEVFKEESIQDIGILWAYMSEAVGNRSINGYPFFGSVRIMHKDDWARAAVAIKREMDRQQDIEV